MSLNPGEVEYCSRALNKMLGEPRFCWGGRSRVGNALGSIPAKYCGGTAG